MVRRSTRSSVGGSAIKQHKRALSDNSPVTVLAKRSKQSKVTPTKNRHFATGDEAERSDELKDDHESSPSVAESVSDFEEASQAASEPSDSSQSDFDDDEKVVSRSAKAKPSGRAQVQSTSTKEGVQWKSGVKTGLGPGTQVIIKKPKARPAGTTPYADDTVHPNTLLFLSELKENNKREWLKLHDPDFRHAEKDWHTFVEAMTKSLMAIDDTIPELPVKDVVFRIYRDIRFSKDHTPYKAWFSVAWSRAGRKGPFAHYYIQCAPNNSFVGGGLWHPEAAPTAAMRRAIDRRSRQLKDVLLDPRIRKEFLKGAAATDKAVTKAFVERNSENALKTKPKGYDADHADIALLRLRNYTIGRQLTDEEVLGKKGKERIVELLGVLQPFITYLNSVVMPDDEGESSEDEGDEEEASDGDDDEEESGDD